MRNLFLMSALATGVGLVSITAELPAQSFTNLHSFMGSDGAGPSGDLVLSGDHLYGTTFGGGSSGNGTVFRMQTDGTGFTNLYHFTATPFPYYTNSDGANPPAGLILSGGTLYGTANGGGTSGNGTVFAINTDGTDFRTLHSFTQFVYQVAGLILSGDTLYGTTDLGGTSGTGSIFKLNTNGTAFSILHSFPQGTPNAEGAYPLAALTLSGGTLYGTAAGGGSTKYGTVFRLSTDGTGFTNLHTFTSDAYDPNAGLVLSGDTLYGAAITGVGSSGSVFRLNTNGAAYTNLYYFNGGDDGRLPGRTLSLSGDTLYGATGSGGSSSNGVIFKINTEGAGFTVLHSFSAATSVTNTDGASPKSSVFPSGNILYGSAYSGGSSGNGTLFSLFVLPELTITPADANVILTWPSNYTGFTLHSTTNIISPAVWTTVSPASVVVNGLNTVTNPVSGTRQFYRLSQ